MAVSFQLPNDLEQNLRHDLTDLDGEAKEALLVALYRRGKLSHYALSQALGLDRFETEDMLRKHNVTEDLGSVEEHLAEVRSVQECRDSRRRRIEGTRLAITD
jgi:predicted HTH domain antitoxin